MFRYTFNDEKHANKIESAVKKTLSLGYRTADIFSPGDKQVTCSEMGEAVIASLN
jgi:3-isopropylmalate dehydrogenase